MTKQLSYTSAPLPGATRSIAMFRHLRRPIRTVLGWQVLATAMMTLAAAAFMGMHGALSAAAGGLISIIAGLAAAFVASRGGGTSAGGILVGALRAEGVKIGLVVLLLWLVLANYAEAVVIVLIGSFVATMLIFAMAFLVREYE